MDSILDEVQYQRIIKYHPTEPKKCWFKTLEPPKHLLRPNVAIKYFNSKEHTTCCGQNSIQCLKLYITYHLNFTYQYIPLPSLTVFKGCLSEEHLKDPFFLAITCEEKEINTTLNNITRNLPEMRAKQITRTFLDVIMRRYDITNNTKLTLYHQNTDLVSDLDKHNMRCTISLFASFEDIEKWPDFKWNIHLMAVKSKNIQIKFLKNTLYINNIPVQNNHSRDIITALLINPNMYSTIRTILDGNTMEYEQMRVKLFGISRSLWSKVLSFVQKHDYSFHNYFNMTTLINGHIINNFQCNAHFTYDDYIRYKDIIKPNPKYIINAYVKQCGCDSEEVLNKILIKHKLNPLNIDEIDKYVHVKYNKPDFELTNNYLMSNMSLTYDNVIKYFPDFKHPEYIDNGLYYNRAFIDISIYESDVVTHIKKQIMAKRIQRQWRESISNPQYVICRKRLLCEYITLIE